MAFGHAGCGSLVLITDYLLAALVKVYVEENHLLDRRHVENPLQIEVNFVTSVNR